MPKPYRDLSTYLKEKIGHKTVKICIDGGFTCPNRDGRVGVGGCLFCGSRGAGDFALDPAQSIAAQVKERLCTPLGGRRATRFLAYFQNFSCTYASPAVLRARYNAALCDARVVGLAIATRPDCINEEIAALLGEYAARMPLWVELGLQTANEETAKAMNMACPRSAFREATEVLARHGVESVVHMIVGLPGEDMADYMATLHMINESRVQGIKIHSLYVTADTGLARMYEAGKYTPLTFSGYTESVACLLAHLRPDIVVHRLTGDPPSDLLLAPDWCRDKNAVLARIHQIMQEQGWEQGCLIKPGERRTP